MDPVSPAQYDEGGIHRIRRGVAPPPGGIRADEDVSGANQAKAEKLRRKDLQRRAGARGLELRHSDSGYALIDSARQRIDDRADMTLDEIESCLERD
jgi:hypothetical protein